jgi:hypothetical protein
MKRVARIILMICLALPGFSSVAMVNAGPLADPATKPAFTTQYWRLADGGLVERGSPTLADLNGDDISEVIIGTTAQNGAGGYNRDMLLVVMKWDGTSGADNMDIWWTKDTGAPINSTPAVGDIDEDGYPEIVVSVGGDVGDQNQDGGVRAYDRNGNPLWFFKTHDWLDHNGYADGVFSSPTLCDVDADGDLEIAFGGWDQRIYLLDHNGNSLWNTPGWGDGYFVQDTIWSTAACADLNQDGFKEIIIGGDMTGSGTLLDGTHTQDGGLIYIFDKDGDLLVRRYLPEAIYAAPAVGDLDGDGDLEIVSGTSWAWWDAHGRTDQPYVYVFDTDNVFNSSMSYSDPNKLPDASGWPRPTTYPGFSSPALADLDGDGDLEIVIGSGDPFLNISDPVPGEGKVYAWHHNGNPVSGWPVTPVDRWGNDTYVSSSPTIADVDGDGGLEIMFGMVNDVYVYSPDGSPQELDQYNVPWSDDGMLHTWDGLLWGSPTVGDADGDGKVEIWIGGKNSLDPGVGHLWRFESDRDVEEMPWPMFHRDARNTGAYSLPGLRTNPGSMIILHEYGSGPSESSAIHISNSGDGEIAWEATAPLAVTLGSYSGTVDVTGETVGATISVGSYITGTHDLGTITVTGTIGGEEVNGSPAEIPVTLYVGTVHRVYLPAALRGN